MLKLGKQGISIQNLFLIFGKIIEKKKPAKQINKPGSFSNIN